VQRSASLNVTIRTRIESILNGLLSDHTLCKGHRPPRTPPLLPVGFEVGQVELVEVGVTVGELEPLHEVGVLARRRALHPEVEGARYLRTDELAGEKSDT
jgi:hypothetical protein